MAGIVAIQMDPVEGLNFRTDTTLLLGHEAARRGYEVYYYLPRDMVLQGGTVEARAHKVAFRPGQADFYGKGEAETLDLRRARVILMRQDPPFDMAYLTATYLLELLQPDVLVVNDPGAVRSAPEKLFMFRFPEFIPPTLVTRDADAIQAFFEQHEDIVLKPLYGYAGHGVFRVRMGDTNFHALLELLLEGSPEPLVAQRFLPEIRQMDKRVLVIDGKVSAVLGRVPAQGDIRANFRAGGSGAHVEPSARDLLIGETVGKVLAQKGILLAGLDVIGDYLTEINVTCPTGMPKSNELYGIRQERMLWDAIEARL